jgi:hypothetical protein
MILSSKTKKLIHKSLSILCFASLALLPFDNVVIIPSVETQTQPVTQINPFYQTPIQTQVLDLGVRQNQPLILTVPPLPVGNDNLPAISIEMLTPPSNGSYTYDPATTVLTYMPSQDYIGTDLIYFQACYSATQCVDVTMNITVEQLNNTNPLITLDRAITNDQTVVESLVVAAKQVATITVNQQPANGTLNTDVSAQSVTYDPAAGFVGTDEVNYTACYIPDDSCQSYRLLITINGGTNPDPDPNPNPDPNPDPTPVLQPPVAVDDSITITNRNLIGLNVLVNDTDPLQAPAVSQIVTAPTLGQAVINTNTGNIDYTPSTDANNTTDQLTYEICNADGCDTALLQITYSIPDVTPDPDPNPTPDPTPQPPIPVDDNIILSLPDPISIDILANDIDTLQEPDFVRIIEDPTIGTATWNDTTNELDYEPDPAIDNTTDQLRYEICNPDGCANALVTIVYSYVLPDEAIIIAREDEVFSTNGEPVTFDVLTNDETFPENNYDLTTLAIIENPVFGTATIDPATALITYTPGPDALSDSFVYTICDTFGVCSQALVTIFVEFNDSPDPVPDPTPAPTPDPVVDPTPAPITNPDVVPDIVTNPPINQPAQQPEPQVLGAFDDGTSLPRTGGVTLRELSATISLLLLSAFGLITTLFETQDDDY